MRKRLETRLAMKRGGPTATAMSRGLNFFTDLCSYLSVSPFSLFGFCIRAFGSFPTTVAVLKVF